MPVNRSHSGQILFEALIAIIIAAPILAALVNSIHHSVLLNSKLSLQNDSTKAILRVRSILENALHSSDLHHLAFTARVSKHGAINFTDGSNNPIMQAPSPRAPAADSDALSTIRLESAYTLEVLKRNILGNATEFFACPKFPYKSAGVSPPSPKLSTRENYLGISSDGLFELSGKVVFWKNDALSQNCYQLTLSLAPSMVIATTPVIQIHNITTIVPMRENYTLYVDGDGNLRYLSHSAGNNIENQPLLGGIENLRLRLDYAPKLHTHALHADLKLLNGYEDELHFITHLAHIQHFNLLLN